MTHKTNFSVNKRSKFHLFQCRRLGCQTTVRQFRLLVPGTELVPSPPHHLHLLATNLFSEIRHIRTYGSLRVNAGYGASFPLDKKRLENLSPLQQLFGTSRNARCVTPQITPPREARAPQNNSVLTTFPFLDNIHYCPFFQADIGLRLLFVVVQYNEVFENNGRTDVGTICKINK